MPNRIIRGLLPGVYRSYRQVRGELTESGEARGEHTLTWAISRMLSPGSPLHASLGASRGEERPYDDITQKRGGALLQEPSTLRVGQQCLPPSGH